MINKKMIQLSKTVSRILRHEPWLYELELDEEGWVPVEELISALHLSGNEWCDVNEKILYEMIQQASKKRHELKAGKIRALYGHSISQKLIKEIAEPPEILFHGTNPALITKIVLEGLKPMKRQYVHLSLDIRTAKEVGMRKTSTPIILQVNAKEAHKKGVRFYIGNECIWLADHIPSVYIDFNYENG